MSVQDEINNLKNDEAVIDVPGFPFAMTKSAIEKAYQLLLKEDELYALRVAVSAGGCSGLRYQLYFDRPNPEVDDQADFGEITALCDKRSSPYLQGAVINYIEDLNKMGFVVLNPNAQGSCACGDSFN